MSFKIIQLAVFMCIVLKFGSTQPNKIVCYWESWHEDTLPPEEIDPNVCTHINYSFMDIAENGTLLFDDSVSNNEELLQRLNALKEANPDIKIMLSVGGYTDYAPIFADIATDNAKRENLVYSVLYYLNTFELDGIDLAWEFPEANDTDNFNSLLLLLRNALTDNGNYELSVAVYHIPDNYDAPTISEIVDFINVLTYDLHDGTEGKTGQSSPLYASSVDDDFQKATANCNASITNWINAGATPEKLVMGLAFYGKAFVLADPEENGVGAPISSGGEDGGSHYRDICQETDGWTFEWDDQQKNPYKYMDDQWIGYDDPQSIGLKADFVRDLNLGGVMFWVLNYDDVEGNCGTKNALQQAIIESWSR